VNADHFKLAAIAILVAVIGAYLLLYVTARLYAHGNPFRLFGVLLMLASAIAAIAVGWLAYQGLTQLMAG
jgi:hypothetical protein